MDFLNTNINDIIAYILIIVNAIMYIMNNRKVNMSGLAMRDYVKTSAQAQTKKSEEIMTLFQENAFKELANGLTTLQGTVNTLEGQLVQAKQDAAAKALASDRAIQDLQRQLGESNTMLAKINKTVYTDMEKRR